VNISDFSNIQPYLPKVSSSPGRSGNSLEEVPSSERIPGPSTKGAEGKKFYEYEEQPWLTDPTIEFATSREEYVFYKGLVLAAQLRLLKDSYSTALVDLADAHPDIAAKKFSITMSEDGAIKIIDTHNEMSDEDIDTLTMFLNDASYLRGSVQMVVQGILLLADHDHDTFGGRYGVGLEDIKRVLDIGKILNESVDMMRGEWVRQIETNAERLPVSYVSVSV
jgi:hypothetical protein